MVTPDLSVAVGSVRLKNPVLTASGTFGYGLEFLPFGNVRNDSVHSNGLARRIQHWFHFQIDPANNSTRP